MWIVAGGLAALGVVVLVALVLAQRREAEVLVNPIAPSPESIAVGESIYRTHCQVCHGVSGRGDGPAASNLPLPPADFRFHMAAGHTDAQFFRWISDGIPDLGMPGFRRTLTVEERWHVLNFLQRTFTPAEE
jgi:mono/diheme cytochrome c family protein